MRTAPGTEPVLLQGLKIAWLSCVTRPAHAGAVPVLAKGETRGLVLLKAKHGRGGRFRRKKRPSEKDDETKKFQGLFEEIATWLGKALEDSKHEDLWDYIGAEFNGAPTLEKFDDDRTPVTMTSSEEGHAHLLYITGQAGSTTWGKSEDAESGHDHPFMLTLDDGGVFTVVIGDSEGHSHSVDTSALTAAFAAAALSKFQLEDDMPKPTTIEKTADHKKAEGDLVLARLFGGLNDAERAHFADLADLEKPGFLKLDSAGRATVIKTAETEKSSSDKVVYKADNGAVYHESDDERVVTMAKERDADHRLLEKALGKNETSRLAKAGVEAWGSLPGDDAAKGVLYKALEDIEDPDERKAAFEAVTAGDSALSQGFQTLGRANTEEELGLAATDGSPAAKLSKMAKTHAEKAGDGMTEDVAMGIVVATPEGRELYRQIQHATTNTGHPVN